MEVMRKNLLVVGDSFMSPERFRHKYFGKHWTEKSKKYNIINLAKPGYSNYNIIKELHNAIEHNIQFDYVLIWFTEHRLTFKNTKCSDANLLGPTLTNCSTEYLTVDQNLAVKYYFTEICAELRKNQTALEILGILSWLKNTELKFLFNFGLWQGTKYMLPSCNINQELMKFQNSVYNLSEINLEHYTAKNKLIINDRNGPSYHTTELWQDYIVQVVEKKFEEVYGE